ncbi:hypothetical protein FRC08_003555 [Ceratobasidium sp. 394]|nr:hypothetical protein FRC08_003555 [Ceratobasidium sp. 394]KAG9100311.1 hypothetical protein FS749_015720 [Ceratobasidium sp. UAMH 11750]
MIHSSASFKNLARLEPLSHRISRVLFEPPQDLTGGRTNTFLGLTREVLRELVNYSQDSLREGGYLKCLLSLAAWTMWLSLDMIPPSSRCGRKDVYIKTRGANRKDTAD